MGTGNIRGNAVRGRRSALIRLALTLGAPLLAGPALAAVEWGREYVPVKSPQAPETPGKIDVVEFFSYACPHCFRLEAVVGPWSRKLPQKVDFLRMPVAFNDSTLPLARAYFALESMGLLDRLHLKIFEALHEHSVPLNQEKVLLEWIGRAGADTKRFADTYRSFGIEARLKRARFLAQAYDIDSVPTLVVGGKYLTSAAMAGSKESRAGCC